MTTLHVATQTEDTALVQTMRVRYEGANIRTWIGFKHLMYLVEEGVLEWFRARGVGPQRLFHEYGLGLEVSHASVQLPALVEVDDRITVVVQPKAPGAFQVSFRIERATGTVTGLRGQVRVALVQESTGPAGRPAPKELVPLVVSEVADCAIGATTRQNLPLAPEDDAAVALHARDPRSFVWSWRARYFHCHYSDRVQHSAYVRALEEVVDHFLESRDLPIGRVLQERGWIPVVSRVSVALLADTHMEETVHSVFSVGDVLKASAYDARMDCYVQRGGELVHVASARILHGYAHSRGPQAGQLVELDQTTIRALTGIGSC